MCGTMHCAHCAVYRSNSYTSYGGAGKWGCLGLMGTAFSAWWLWCRLKGIWGVGSGPGAQCLYGDWCMVVMVWRVHVVYGVW